MTDLFSSSKGWSRYYHQKSSNLKDPKYNSNLTLSHSTNPYEGISSLPSITGTSIYNRDKLITAEDPTSSYGASFSLAHSIGESEAYKGGYLESNRIPLSNMPQGDIYQIKTRIKGNDLINLFDINIGTGDISTGLLQTDSWINGDCYKRMTGTSIFSTFNHGLKWATKPYSGDQTDFSNYFVMPNLPVEYDGINIQVGPANSDNNFSTSSALGVRPSIASTYPNYNNLNVDKGLTSSVMSGADIPNNFGIGLPWNMLRKFFADKDAISFGMLLESCRNNATGCDGDFWYNDRALIDNNPSFPSKPISINPSVKLNKVELIRYAKNPYMLSRVKKYVKNSDCIFSLISVLALKHEIITAPIYVSSKTVEGFVSSPSQIKSRLKGYRNIVRLNQIRQLPNIESTNWDDYPIAPTVTFNYDLVNPNSSWGGGCVSQECDGSLVNSSINVITKITDPLGKETTFEYLPLSDALGYNVNFNSYLTNDFTDITTPTGQNSFILSTYSYRYKSSELALQLGNAPYACASERRYRMNPGSFQVYMIVKKKGIKDNVGVREWNYSYQNFKAYADEHPYMTERFKWDYSTSYKVGFEKTTVAGIDGDVVEYTHLVDKFYWGKIQQILSKDAWGRPMSKSESVWNSTLAFESGIFRVSNPALRQNAGGDYFDYEGSGRPNPLSITDAKSYFYQVKSWLTALAPNYRAYPDEQNGNFAIHPENGILHYESRYAEDIGTRNPYYLNSFFVYKSKETNTQYDQYGYSTQIVKEFDYYGADCTGKPFANAYQKLLGQDAYNQLNDRLYREPSWQLFSVKTYSPQQPDAYTIEENFYYYDLSNIFKDRITDLVNLISPVRSYDVLDNAYVKGMRNLPFEKRVSKKAWGEAPIIQSAYFHYSAKERPTVEQCQDSPSGGAISDSPNTPEDTPLPPIYVYLDAVATQVKAADVQPQLTLQFNSSTLGTLMTFSYPYTSIVTQQLGQYNSWAQPKEAIDIKGLKTTFEYEGKIGLMKRAEVGAGLPNSQVTTYNYRSDNKLDYALDPNSTKISYQYDNYGRMIKGFRNDVLLQEILQYSNFNNNLTTSFATRASQNFVETKVYLSDTEWWSGRGYVDPLGRKYATVKENVVMDNTFYDRYDRAFIRSKPKAYQAANHNQLIDFNGNATDESQIVYDAAPSNKIIRTSKYGLDINGSKVVQNYSYLADDWNLVMTAAWLGSHNDWQTYVPQPAMNSMSSITDEDGKQVTDYTNVFGQKVATASVSGFSWWWPTYAVTMYKYDSHGNVKQVSNPKSQVSNYEYNYLNQLYRKTEPDGGSYVYAYNKNGQLIAEYNYKLWETYQARLFVYDKFGRMTKQLLVPIWDALYFDGGNGAAWINLGSTFDWIYDYLVSSGQLEKEWFYDNYDNSRVQTYASNVQQYLNNSFTKAKGRLAQTISYDNIGQPVDMRFFSYNNDGFMKWEMQQFNQNGIAATDKGRVIRIDYPKYNRQGGVLVQNIDLNGDKMLDMQYAYKYDNQGRLIEVYANTDNAETNGYKVASFAYDPVFGTLQTKTHHQSFPINGIVSAACKNRAIDVINYEYDLRRRLTTINASSGLFNWQMFYDANNPANSGSNTSQNWNGNINSTVATYNGNLMTGFSTATTYNYQYDVMNRLVSADVAQAIDPSGSDASLGDESYAYDYIGNITTLLRGELNNGSVQNMAYTYNYQNNKLTSVTDNLGNTRTMSYDAVGNLLTDSKRGIDNMVYGRSNLQVSFSVTKDGTTNNIKYLYGVNDSRIYKKTNTTEELYIEAGGKTVAVFDMGNNDIDWFAFGTERVAKLKYTPTGGWVFTASASNSLPTTTTGDPFATPLSNRGTIVMQTDFYLYDHLGNSRVTYRSALNYGSCSASLSYSVQYAADYYPYGKILREYKPSGGKNERYLTTQHERDAESGLDYRGARFYDSDLGRFLSLDPMAAKYAGWGAYSYVLGNPLSLTDDSGEEPEPPKIYIINFAVNDEAAERIRQTVNRIFTNNGINVDVNLITFEQAKNTQGLSWTWNEIGEDFATGYLTADPDYPNVYGIAITNDAYGLGGLTHPDGRGIIDQVTTSGWNNKTNKDLTKINSAFLSFTNYGVQARLAASESGDVDLVYRTGYNGAHEILHQMLLRAAERGESVPYSTDGSTQGTLGQAGHNDKDGGLNAQGTKVKVPKQEPKKLDDSEKILPEHKKALGY